MTARLVRTAMQVVWKSTPTWPIKQGASPSDKPLKIAILDSSFDPPTRAHYAIAAFESEHYDAHLLLLSSVNADKGTKGKPGHANLQQRTEMMELMAKRMAANGDIKCETIAVATLAAANYADKAPIVLDLLRGSPALASRPICLTFFIGFDTVVRLFAKRYYNDSEEELERVIDKFLVDNDCDVICIRRPEHTSAKDAVTEEEGELCSRPYVKRYMQMHKLRMANIPAANGISSTKIRNSLKQTESGTKQPESPRNDWLLPEVASYCLHRRIYDELGSSKM
ncbi:hypothetical protein EMMF5_005694 [Cystobasidiomycetes sp. EMM_F5]